MYIKEIICLANSRKPPSGRCVAGKTKDGEWVRPISSRPTHEVSEDERRYESGQKAALLDVIQVPLVSHNSNGHQVENHILDADYYWEQMDTTKWATVKSLCDPYDQNFWAPSANTIHGVNDKIFADQAMCTLSSLKLVHIRLLKIIVATDPGYRGGPGRRRVRGEFRYSGERYRLMITDPEIEDYYLKEGNGNYELADVCLCISLAEVWADAGFASRLIASVIHSTRCFE